MDIDLIFEEEFMESKTYEKWNDSFVSAIEHALEPTKEFIRKWKDKYGKLPKSEPIKDDYPWAIKNKEEIITLKTDLIIKSIELGLFFKKLAEKED